MQAHLNGGIGRLVASSMSAPISEPRKRTRTGCRECRSRRVKCTEGKRTPYGKEPCQRCTSNDRLCEYPGPTGKGWTPAVARISSKPSETLAQQHALKLATQRLAVADSGVYATGSAPITIAAPLPIIPATISGSTYRTLSPEDAPLLEYIFSGSVAHIGARDVTAPEQDNFRSCLLPYLKYVLATGPGVGENEWLYIYHATLRFAALHRHIRQPSQEHIDAAEKHTYFAGRAMRVARPEQEMVL